jgi:hypothetical protein
MAFKSRERFAESAYHSPSIEIRRGKKPAVAEYPRVWMRSNRSVTVDW